jgi:hypothetical protein
MNVQTSRSKLEVSIALGFLIFGVLIACSSNELPVTAFGISLMLLGGALYRWG